jgi:hypothetical protein
MSEVRVWLVDRTYNDKGMIELVYATTDGERYHHRQLSEQMLVTTSVTAAEDVSEDRLEPTAAEDREHYESEAARMADEHDPDEEV